MVCRLGRDPTRDFKMLGHDPTYRIHADNRMKKKSRETIRTFISVELPQEIHDKLRQTQDHLRASMPDVRWTKSSNIHLTLKFLGDVEISRIDAINKALTDIAGRFPPFTMTLTGLGAFPNSRKPRPIISASRSTVRISRHTIGIKEDRG